MSFYVTLPSNTPSHVVNTQSDFTTFLNDSIKFEGEYEVALSEINFSANFNFNFGTLILKHNDFLNQPIIIPVEVANGITLVDLVNHVNIILTFEINYLLYKKQTEELLSRDDNSIRLLTKNYFIKNINEISNKDYYSKSIKLSVVNYFVVKNNIIVLTTPNLNIEKCEGLIKSLFPFINEEYLQFDMSRFLPDRFNIINYIIVYTDIIDHQYFGNKKTQILRSVPISYNFNDIQTNFDTHHYVKVKDSYVNSINIKLRDIWGNPIHFSDFFSYVIINLHFRQVK